VAASPGWEEDIAQTSDPRHCQLRQLGDHHRLADLQTAEAPDLREKQWYQIGRAVNAGADHKGLERAQREIAVIERAQIADRLMVGQHPPEKERGRRPRCGS
jgi:hypothetical protein